jgi:iron complex outermembrane receptor protein
MGGNQMRDAQIRKLARRSATSALALLSCGAPLAARAQQAPAGASTVSEVIVTAQRRAERLENVPMSVSAVSNTTLAKAGIVGLHDLGQVVPGLHVNSTGFATQPTIRGVTTVLTGIGFDNNVAIYVDGFYESGSTGINADLANIAGVEVLKGPQGTLYGRNATGGAILINTLDPAETVEGDLELSYGRYRDWYVKGYVSAPINDKMGFNLAVYDHQSDGWYRRVSPTGADLGPSTPIRQEAVRAKLQLRPTEDLTLTLGYNYTLVLDPTGDTFNVYRYSPLGPLFRPGTETTTSWSFRPNNEQQTNEFTLVGLYRTPLGDLTSHTAYSKIQGILNYDFDGVQADVFHGRDTDIGETVFQQAFDYNVTAIPNTDLLVGLSLYTDFVASGHNQSFLNGALSTVAVSSLKDHAYAGYIDATYHFTPRLAVTGGGRYTQEYKSGCWTETDGRGQLIVQPGCRKETFSRFTPRGVIRYELAPRTNVYASIAQGFRSGTFNPSPQPSLALDAPVAPEKITAYEIGLKTAQGRFRFDTAAFYYKYTDLQVSATVPNPVTNQGTIQTLANAKAAEIYGLEGELSAAVTEDLQVRAGLALLHAEYTDFDNAVGTGFNPATQRDVANQTQDWTGKKMVRSPDVTFNIGADYSHPLWNGELLATANLSYTSSYINQNASTFFSTAVNSAGQVVVLNPSTEQRYVQPGYVLLNLSIGWTDPSGHFTTKLYANNVTNTKYRITDSGGSFGDYAMWGEPVNYGVRFAYKY